MNEYCSVFIYLIAFTSKLSAWLNIICMRSQLVDYGPEYYQIQLEQATDPASHKLITKTFRTSINVALWARVRRRRYKQVFGRDWLGGSECCLIYLDDIILSSSTIQEHAKGMYDLT